MYDYYEPLTTGKQDKIRIDRLGDENLLSFITQNEDCQQNKHHPNYRILKKKKLIEADNPVGGETPHVVLNYGPQVEWCRRYEIN